MAGGDVSLDLGVGGGLFGSGSVESLADERTVERMTFDRRIYRMPYLEGDDTRESVFGGR